MQSEEALFKQQRFKGITTFISKTEKLNKTSKEYGRTTVPKPIYIDLKRYQKF